MAEYKVVPSQDDGLFTVEGLKNIGILGKFAVTFPCEFLPADGDLEKKDKLTQAVYELRHENPNVQDGDMFDTQYGKLVVRGNLVVADDNGTQAQAAATQGNVPTGPQNVSQAAGGPGGAFAPNTGPVPTLGQAAAARGMILPPNLQPHANTPINQLPMNISAPPGMLPKIPPPPPPPSSATGVQSLSNLGGQPAQTTPGVVTFTAYDQTGASLQAALQPFGTTSHDVVEAFDNYINNAFGVGDIRSVISVPGTSRRVIEVEYSNGSFRVVLDVV